ncbi:jg2738 [Pararge aegeria aegeria]|uniref:Jg2738 protein n=1 Tax=Pararge aegeria aegeria TaxID=348720 RepID=A0A8S4RB19_9NEOP|nr:jg2738 [Pararge aegeria aegeria]
MERSFLNIKRKERVRNVCIRKKTKATDAIKHVLVPKWKWAGHIQRVKDERWSYIVTNWYPRDSKRRRGRPLRRWSGDITQIAGKTWARAAMDRKSWLLMEEAFTAKCGPYNKY